MCFASDCIRIINVEIKCYFVVLHKINMGGDVSVNVKLSQVINLMPC